MPMNLDRKAQVAAKLVKRLSKPERAAAFRRRMREWIGFLRDDHDYDYDYILAVLAYKLGRTRQYIKGHNLIKDAGKVAREIKEVEGLIRKVMADDYHEEVFASFYKKHGHPRRVTREAGPRGLVECDILYGGKSATPAMRREQARLYEREDEARKADLRKAFDLMVERIWGWWE